MLFQKPASVSLVQVMLSEGWGVTLSRSFSGIPSAVPISEPQPFAVQICLALSSGRDLYRLQYLERQMKAGQRPEQSSVPCCWCLSCQGGAGMLAFLLP